MASFLINPSPVENLTKQVYRQCSHCVLDTNDDANIEFDSNGKCSHCYYYDEQYRLLVPEAKAAQELLEKKIAQIKEAGKGKKYDCIIGISGGADSSYVAYLAHQFQLRPLCVHFDNGWNSELAVKNIESLVTAFKFDLYSYVIDWEEFKDLQLAYLKASVVDIEVLTDHAIYGVMFKIAKENNIQFVLAGHNVATEGILPYHWTYNKKDYVNIQAIHKMYGEKKLLMFPFLDPKMKKFIFNSGVEFVNYLNWTSYNVEAVKQLLQRETGWRDYGLKHHESIWTRFYQGYILPVKFGIDKRKAHFSSLICSGQMTKEEALEQLQRPFYQPNQLKQDMEFVFKKLGLSKEEFEEIMKRPVQSHWDFGWEGSIFYSYPALKPFRPLWEGFKKITGIRKA